MLWGALLVATNLLNTCIKVLSKLDKNLLSYEQNTICIRTKYNSFWKISIFLNETNLIRKVRPNYIFSMNISYLTVDSVDK